MGGGGPISVGGPEIFVGGPKYELGPDVVEFIGILGCGGPKLVLGGGPTGKPGVGCKNDLDEESEAGGIVDCGGPKLVEAGGINDTDPGGTNVEAVRGGGAKA